MYKTVLFLFSGHGVVVNTNAGSYNLFILRITVQNLEQKLICTGPHKSRKILNNIFVITIKYNKTVIIFFRQ